MNQPNTPQEINKEVPPLSVADAPKDNLQSVLASEGKAMDVTTPKPTVAPDDKNQHDKSTPNTNDSPEAPKKQPQPEKNLDQQKKDQTPDKSDVDRSVHNKPNSHTSIVAIIIAIIICIGLIGLAVYSQLNQV